jgi:hypothetical protein
MHFLDEDGSSEENETEDEATGDSETTSYYGRNESSEGEDELYSSENNFGDDYSTRGRLLPSGTLL